MKKNVFYLFATLALSMMLYLLFYGFTYNADFKFGYIISTKVWQEFPEAIEVQKKINDQQAEYEKEYKAKEEVFNSKRTQYESQQLMLSEVKKNEMIKEIQQLGSELQNFQQTIFDPQNGALAQKWSTLMQPVVDKVQNAIDKIGKEEGYDLILDAKEDGSILYSKEEHNLTVKVLELLKKK